MPNIGDTLSGKELGLADSHKRIWVACPDCGKERWVLLRNRKPQSERCHPCGAKVGGIKKAAYRGDSHWNWKGGRHQCSTGYIQVIISPEDPFFPMTDKRGRVLEHRLVMARMLGRCLDPLEEVHHKNWNKQDNSPDNLTLSSKGRHNQNHTISKLLARIKELEKQLEEK